MLPNAGLPSVVDGEMHYDLTAEQFVDFHRRFVTEFGVTVVGGCCGTTPEYIRQLAEAVSGLEPKPRAPRLRARRRIDLLTGHPRRRRRLGVEPDHDRRAHQRQRLQEVPRGHARGRLGHLRRRWPRTRSRRGRTSSTSASTTSAATATADMDEIAQRFATQSSVPAGARLDRARGPRGRAALARRQGHPELGQPRGRRGGGIPDGPGVPPGQAVRGSGHRACSSTRRARPATSSGRCVSRTASTTWPSSATAWSPRT